MAGWDARVKWIRTREKKEGRTWENIKTQSYVSTMHRENIDKTLSMFHLKETKAITQLNST